MKRNTKRKVFDIISYIIIGIVFVLSIAGLITKFNNGTLYLFGKRADVVLSDSMSEKNEKYLDFLEGHDDQIQKMDLVVSKKVTGDSELNVYDIVIFDNPGVGTTMHRIVDKQIKDCDRATVYNSTKTEFAGSSVLVLNDLGSHLETSMISYTTAKVVVYSKVPYDDNYIFGAGSTPLVPTVTSTQVDDYYINVFEISKESTTPQRFIISHAKEFDTSNFYLYSVDLSIENREIQMKPASFEKNDEGDYEFNTNIVYQYEIRGDKAPNSDGIFLIKSIQAKVEFAIPKAGLFVRFITSIYGLILMIGIGFLLIGTNMVLDYSDRKEKTKLEAANVTEEADKMSAAEEQKTEESKEKDESK